VPAAILKAVEMTSGIFLTGDKRFEKEDVKMATEISEEKALISQEL